MTFANERMRSALREIECKAANALANQPERTDANTRHLHTALSGIRELANTDWLALIPARNI